MTRVNLVPVDELSDQHLFAEWRGLELVPRSLNRSLTSRGVDGVLRMVPPAYVLGKGHVSFFYDKGAFLRRRYAELTAELERRGRHNLREGHRFDELGVYAGLPDSYQGEYDPPPEALALNRERVGERLAQRPNFHTGGNTGLDPERAAFERQLAELGL